MRYGTRLVYREVGQTLEVEQTFWNYVMDPSGYAQASHALQSDRAAGRKIEFFYFQAVRRSE